jgi:hypothetical protein
MSKPPAGWKDYTAFLIALTLACVYISKAEAYEYNGERWLKKINWYMGTGCPSYVKDSAMMIFDELTENVEDIETNHLGKWNLTPSKDQRTTIYCGTSDVQQTQIERLPWGIEMRVSQVLTEDQDTVAGTAYWYYKSSNNEIVECDVWLNTDSLTVSNADKFVRHELGHCLGMKHSDVVSSVMYYAPVLPHYHVDDWAGLKRLYKDGRPIIDKYLNLYTGTVETTEGLASGILDAGKVWYDDVYNVEVEQ